MTTLKIKNKYTNMRGKYLANGGPTWDNTLERINSYMPSPVLVNPGKQLNYDTNNSIPNTVSPNYNFNNIDYSGLENLANTAERSNVIRNFKNLLNQPSVGGIVNSVSGALGNAVGNGISGGRESGAGNAIGSVTGVLGSAVSKANPLLEAAVTGAGKILSGVTNAAFGTKWNDANIKEIESNINRLNNFTSNANSYDTLSNIWANTQFANNFSDDYIGKQGWFRNNVSNKADDLREQQKEANNFAYKSLEGNAMNIRNKTLSGLEQGYMGAYGGFLHAFGGELDTKGSNFSTGATVVNAGGSHEDNPNGGVFMGMDAQGTPDLVEQNEVIKDGYVYSNRMMVPSELKAKYGLKKAKNISYADAVKEINKKAEERPNDVITKGTQNEIFNDFKISQEKERIKQQEEENNIYNNLQAQKLENTIPDVNTQMPSENIQEEQPEDYNQEQDIETNQEYPDNIDQAAVESTPSFAYGGYLTNFKDMNYFDKGGDKYYKYNNSVIKKGDPLYNIYKDYLNEDGTIDFNKLYNPTSEWSKTRASFLETLADKDLGPKAKQWYADQLNKYNSKFKDKTGKEYTKVTPDMITPEFVSKMSSDRKLGFGHNVIADPSYGISNYSPEIIDQYYLRDLKNHTASLMKDTPWEGTKNGFYYSDLNPYKNTNIIETVMGEDGKRYRKHYYDPIDSDSISSTTTTLGDAKKNYDLLPTWGRMAPLAGLSAMAFTDALGLTNNPVYDEADALLNGYAKSGAYMPVGYNTIPNKLTYNPLSVDQGINTINATASANRRALLNQGSGNRGTMAGILAADNNYINQLASNRLAIANANLDQRSKVNEFNRGTNQTNSTGQYQADSANQAAFNRAKEAYLTGLGSALNMRASARQASDAAKSANMSGLLNSLGAWGKENFNMNQINSNPALYYTTGVNGNILYGNVFNNTPKNTITSK